MRLALALALASPLAGSAAAQTIQTVRIRVVDPAGLAVPGAAISTTGPGGISGVTDASGAVSLPEPQGTSLRASFAGLASAAVAVTGPDLVLVVRPGRVAEAVTVTATRSPGFTGEHAETIDALSSKELRQYAAVTLDESLRQHAGFELFRRASSRVANPTSEGISLRGLGSTAVSRTLVLQQSAPLNDPFGGWIHWDELPPQAVEAVTIATGGGSDLYGSSALGGVIDVVPTRPRTGGGELQASGAGQATSDVSGRLDHDLRLDRDLRLGRGNPLGLATLSGEGFRTGGYIPVNPASLGKVDRPANSHFQNAHTELEHPIGPAARVFLTGNLLNEARGNGTILTNNGTRLWRYLAGTDWSAAERATGRLRLFGSDEGYRQAFSSIPASRATETLTRRQRVRTQELGASTDAAIHFGRFAAVAGADVRDVRANDVETPISAGVVTSVQDTTARQRFAGAFAEALYARGPWSGAASLRLDHAANLDTLQRVNTAASASATPVPDRAELVASPRLGLVRRVNNTVSLKAAAFRAFRSPTMNELYRTGQVGQEITQANAQLLSERATGWEAGANLGQPGDRLSAVATYFWTEINRPVSTVLVTQTASSITYKRQNLGQLRSQGIELKAGARLTSSLSAGLGYQFADATITRFSAQPTLMGNRLPEVPRHAVTAQLRLDSPRAGAYTLALRRSGQIFDDTANTLILHGFFQADLYAERTLAGHLTLFAAVQNLLNQRAEVARTPVLTLGSGIFAQGGLRLRWGGSS